MVRQGHVIWVDFDPQAGHEQTGRRPALVVSNNTFGNFSKLAIVCPITNTDKNHPLHVNLDDRTKTTGVIMCDQVKVIDPGARNYKFIEVIPKDILAEVVSIVSSLIEIE